MAQWIFFDVGSTLVDEAAACDHRVRDMISGTSINLGLSKIKVLEQPNAWSFGAYGSSLA